MKTPSVGDTLQVCMPGDDEVELVPVFRPGVSPGNFVGLLTLEVCVGHTQSSVAAQF